MAALGIALVGAGVGGVFGGVTGALIGYSIGSMVGSLLFPPDLGTVEGPRLQDLQIQSSAEGAPIPQAYGTVRLAGNIIWGKPLQEHRHEEDVGGKGGGGGGEAVSYTYTADFAIALCEGPITAIRKLWADGKLIMDLSEPTADEQATVAAGGFLDNIVQRQQAFFGETMAVGRTGGTIRIYKGDETQLPDPLIEADLGAGQTPAYRGVAYLVFDNFELADYGNRIPNITAEVVVAGSTAPAYLGKITIPQTPDTLDDSVGGYHTVFHYLSSSKCIGLGIWADNNYPTSPVAPYYKATPLTVYPSGQTIFGVDMPTVASAMPSNEYRFNFGYTDEPGALLGWLLGHNSTTFFRWSDLTGSPRQIALRSTYDYPMEWDKYDIHNASSAMFKRGEDIWVWAHNGAALYKFDASFIMDPTLVRPWVEVTSFYVDPLESYTASTMSVWCTDDNFYLYYHKDSVNEDHLAVYDLETKALLYDVKGPYSGQFNEARLYVGGDGLVYLAYRVNFNFVMNLATWDGSSWTILGTLDGITLGSGSYGGRWDHSNTWFVGDGIVIWHIGGALHYWVLNAIGSDTVPLSTIVANICNRAGLESSYINVTDLASVDVRGYLRSSQMAGRQGIEPLARAYRFDAVETDGVLKFIQIGRAHV